MRLLAFGTYDVRSHPRVGVLIEGLRAHGDEVVEVNVPLGIGTAARVALLRRPWRLPLFALRLARCWAALAVRGWRVHRRFHPDAVLVGYLGHFDVRLARRLFRRTPVVLDHLIFAADTARDRKISTGWKIRLLEWLDRGALRSADLVVLDTDEHAALMPADLADRGVVVPVGVPQSWFTAARTTQPVFSAESAVDRPLRAIFFGLFTPLPGTRRGTGRARRPARHRGVGGRPRTGSSCRPEGCRREPPRHLARLDSCRGSPGGGRRTRCLPGHLRLRSESPASGTEQGVSGRRSRLRRRHQRHTTATPCVGCGRIPRTSRRRRRPCRRTAHTGS